MEAAERSDIKQLPQGISLEVFRLKTEWKGDSSNIKYFFSLQINSCFILKTNQDWKSPPEQYCLNFTFSYDGGQLLPDRCKLSSHWVYLTRPPPIICKKNTQKEPLNFENTNIFGLWTRFVIFQPTVGKSN